MHHHPKYPLYMEGDRSPVMPDGSTLWTDPKTAAEAQRPALGYDKHDGSQQIRTIGDLYRYTQELVGQGFKGNPRPIIADLDQNVLLVTLGTISAHRNAQDFGIADMVATPKEAVARDSSILHHWQHYRWDSNGRVIYDLTPEIAQAFLDTDLNIIPDDIELPEGTCYIAVPASLGLKVWHATTGFHDLDGFYVTLSDSGFFIVVCGFAQPGRPSYDNALASFTFARAGDVTIGDWIAQESMDPVSAKIMGPNAADVPTWASLVVNTLLYIANVRDDVRFDANYGVPPQKLQHSKRISGPRVREKFLNEYRHRCRYHLLGEAVTTALRASSKAQSGSSPQVRFSVRGHWRQQPHGPQRALRKLLWIQPFWKGEAGAPVATTRTTHIVKVN